MSAYTAELLSEADREKARELLFRKGAEECAHTPTGAAYLAEYFAEKGFPLRAYACLLYAARLGFAVSQSALMAYENAAKSLSSDEVHKDYEGALALGRELRTHRSNDAVYYLCIAADSEADKFGVAALFAAELLNDDPRFKTQTEKYYALAAQKGNPDLPGFTHHASNGDRYAPPAYHSHNSDFPL